MENPNQKPKEIIEIENLISGKLKSDNEIIQHLVTEINKKKNLVQAMHNALMQKKSEVQTLENEISDHGSKLKQLVISLQDIWKIVDKPSDENDDGSSDFYKVESMEN